MVTLIRIVMSYVADRHLGVATEGNRSLCQTSQLSQAFWAWHGDQYFSPSTLFLAFFFAA